VRVELYLYKINCHGDFVITALGLRRDVAAQSALDALVSPVTQGKGPGASGNAEVKTSVWTLGLATDQLVTLEHFSRTDTAKSERPLKRNPRANGETAPD